MTHDEAWQMIFGNTTPSEAASDLRGKTPEEYVAAAIAECVAACSADENGLREDELRAALEEHADEMADTIETIAELCAIG